MAGIVGNPNIVTIFDVKGINDYDLRPHQKHRPV